ncbi:plastocyanin/azurin family copper-binding protein [Motiliproteus sp.]|uniref:plastocyanin/azurin family copper-binding protein n=1 Tax=Motiliproteus sp. TaxID=1898955 RepID=UPI003BA88E43
MRVLFMVLLAGLLSVPPVAAEVVEVEIRKMRFTPAEIVIKPGDTVVWKNAERRQYHNVWFQQFDAEEPDYLFPGDSYQRTFEQEGEFAYICGPHPKMKAVVIVED